MFRKKSGNEIIDEPEQIGASPTARAEGPRAPAVHAKLDAALAVLTDMDMQVGELALEAVERKPGAAEKLTAHRAKIEAAKTAVAELRAAVELAERLDREADAVAAVKMRKEQFAVMQQKAKARLAEVEKMTTAVATMAECMSRYAILTNEMITALPTGTVLPVVGMGKNNWAGNWLGNLSLLLAGEAWRLAKPDAQGRGARLPFAAPPSTDAQNDPAAIEPALSLMEQAQSYVLAEIAAQLEKLHRDQIEIANQRKAA